MSRGYIFTLDSALAAMLFAGILLSLAYFAAQSPKSQYSALQAKYAADDVLSTFERKGILQTFNYAYISQELNQTLPPHISAQMKIDTYLYIDGNFSQQNSTTFGSTQPNNTIIQTRERLFVSGHSGRILNYSVAKIYVWSR